MNEKEKILNDLSDDERRELNETLRKLEECASCRTMWWHVYCGFLRVYIHKIEENIACIIMIKGVEDGAHDEYECTNWKFMCQVHLSFLTNALIPMAQKVELIDQAWQAVEREKEESHTTLLRENEAGIESQTVTTTTRFVSKHILNRVNRENLGQNALLHF